MLILAAITLIIIAFVHSTLGEMKVIQPLYADSSLTPYVKRLIRVSWHLITVFWMAIALYLVTMDLYPGAERKSFLIIMSSVFSCITLLALFASKGRHLSYIGFGLIALLLGLSI